VPKTVLADRMGCLKAGVVANMVLPTADYVRFGTHYGFRPDFCQANDPESKGLVEHLVGYAKRDLIVPAEPGVDDLGGANAAATAWRAEVNTSVHSKDLRDPGPAVGHRAGVAGRVAVAAPGAGRAADQPPRSTSCPVCGSARPATPTR
jgi:hypothetical protein